MFPSTNGDDREQSMDVDRIFPRERVNKNRRKDIMLCIPYEERRFTNERFGWSFPVAVQPKLDGHRAIALRNDSTGGYVLFTSEGNEINLPHLEDGLRELGSSLPYCFDGEVYLHGDSFEEISSLIKRPRKQSERLRFHIFDLYTPNLNYFFQTRNRILEEAFMRKRTKKADSIRLVPTFMAHSLEEINDAMFKCTNEGYEGIVVRHLRGLYEKKRSTAIMKFKPKCFDVYEIFAVVEAVSASGEPLNMVGSFVVRPTDAGEAYYFSVSAGTIPHTERKYLWNVRQELYGKRLQVSYQSLTAKGIPRAAFAVKVLKNGGIS